MLKFSDLTMERDRAFWAIGRYVAEFSGLVFVMRVLMSDRIVTDERGRELLALALGPLPAQSVADPFFAICRADGALNLAESEIERRLCREVDEEIRRRNVIAHGNWLVVDISMPGAEEFGPRLTRVRPGNVKVPIQTKRYSLAELEGTALEVQELRERVSLFGRGCLVEGEPRVSEVLETVDKRVRAIDLQARRNET